MTPSEAIKWSLLSTFMTSSGLFLSNGGVEATVWYFTFMLSASVLMVTLYSIYLIAGQPTDIPTPPASPPATPTPLLSPIVSHGDSVVPEELMNVIHRSEYRDMVRDFVCTHAAGKCCGELSREDVYLMVCNIQHTQQDITSITYTSVEEFRSHERVDTIFTTTGPVIQLLMRLAVAISSHRMDGFHCESDTSALCIQVKDDLLLRDVYGGTDGGTRDD